MNDINNFFKIGLYQIKSNNIQKREEEFQKYKKNTIYLMEKYELKSCYNSNEQFVKKIDSAINQVNFISKCNSVNQRKEKLNKLFNICEQYKKEEHGLNDLCYDIIDELTVEIKKKEQNLEDKEKFIKKYPERILENKKKVIEEKKQEKTNTYFAKKAKSK
jgi:hypothetical protein